MVIYPRNSIDSGKSRQSRDSDLLNRLAKESSSKASSKSLSRNISFQYISSEKQHHSQMNSSASNSVVSGSEKSFGNNKKEGEGQEQSYGENQKSIEASEMAPKIHNCVCSAAGECLGYNCNCFLSEYPCAPDCCSNCLMLKSSLPLKFTNVCSCKKTRCLKLYCECLSKGLYCNERCKCELCENSEHSVARIESIHKYQMFKGCSCQKSHCQKKYCDCFAQGLKCTNKCICIDCENYLELNGGRRCDESKMDIEESEGDRIEGEEKEPEMEFEQIDFFGGGRKK